MENGMHRIYELLHLQLDLEREQGKLLNSVSRAKYDLRSAKADILEYEGSFRSFLDRLRGMRENHAEELHRAMRHTEEVLSKLERELADIKHRIADTESALSQLPAPEMLPACREKHILEADLCLSALEPILEETLQAMLACRELDQRAGEIISQEERQEILTKPVTVGLLCGSWLQRLEIALFGLDIAFKIPDFYRSPAAYLAATQYTRRDRLNTAIDQTVLLKKLLPQLREIIE